jgi:hypothetical protein
MTFKEALKKLNIEDYGRRIFHSSSTGELMHLMDYVEIATAIKDATWFRPLFVAAVKYAEENWSRPESCFQHMPQLMQSLSDAMKEKD